MLGGIMFNVSTVVLSDVDIRIYENIKTEAVRFHKQYVAAVSKTNPLEYKLNMITRLFLYIKELERIHKIKIWKQTSLKRKGF